MTEHLNLQLTAERARRNVLRMLEAGKSGHMGGTMSAIDALVTLYFHTMKIDPQDPEKDDRDRFLLSAGHKAMSQYAVLAEAGYFPKDILDTYGALDSRLPGHPDMKKLPGVEGNTGALGHGLPIASGMALGARVKKNGVRVFTLLGDGELPEGSNWEGAAIAAHHKLDNLVAIVDVNGLQISGATKDVMNMEPIGDKFRAFGWAVKEVDGHDFEALTESLDNAPVAPGKPTAIIIKTIKGKGVSSVEGTKEAHYWSPNRDDLKAAIEENDARIRTLEAQVNKL